MIESPNISNNLSLFTVCWMCRWKKWLTRPSTSIFSNRRNVFCKIGRWRSWKDWKRRNFCVIKIWISVPDFWEAMLKRIICLGIRRRKASRWNSQKINITNPWMMSSMHRKLIVESQSKSSKLRKNRNK